MPEILPPYQVETPEYVPGMAISVQPLTSRHAFWLDDYEYYDQLGRDPLQVRRIWGINDGQVRVEKLKEMLEHFPKQKHRRQILLKAARRGDEDIVRYLVGTGLRVHVDMQETQEEENTDAEVDGEVDYMSIPDKDDPSVTPVHMAAAHGRLGCLKIFIEQCGIDVDVRDEMGRTPFLAAARANEPEVMKYLLAQGADPTARGVESDLSKEYLGEYAKADAIEFAAADGNIEILEMLLNKQGVEVTPLAIKSAATGRKNYKALRLLLERGGCLLEGQDEIVVNESNEELRQALVDATPPAVEVADLDTIKLLLSYQYPAIKNSEVAQFEVPESLIKPFTYGAYNAVVKNDPDKFEFIHSLGIKEHETMSLDDLPEGQLINYQHLLDKAAEAGSIDCARLLIEKYGADPNKYRIPPGVLPLYWAAGNDKPEMVRYLLDHHVDIHMGNGRFSTGPTALWIAVQLKSLESVSALLQHGGPVNHVDEEILNMDGPLNAVLIAHLDGEVRFETGENAREYIREARNMYQRPNSPYVRIALGAEDKAWIRKLQHRKQDKELREDGRELNSEEADNLDDLDPQDVRRKMPDFPIIDEERLNQLNEDDDLIPQFTPAFASA